MYAIIVKAYGKKEVRAVESNDYDTALNLLVDTVLSVVSNADEYGYQEIEQIKADEREGYGPGEIYLSHDLKKEGFTCEELEEIYEEFGIES